MNIAELFQGVAIVIDDEIGKDKHIDNILGQIKTMNIPTIQYNAIPDVGIVRNFRNISFLLLDWYLHGGSLSEEQTSSGVSIPQAMRDSDIQQNIDLLIKMRSVCFCPIFIFTNENPTTIEAKLVEEGLYREDGPNSIFVRSKYDLQGSVS